MPEAAPLNGCRLILLDLDGTLVDTAPDMVSALNALRASEELPPLPLAELRNVVSQGAIGLLRAGMPEAGDDQTELWRQAFLEYYADALCVDSRLFPGIDEILTQAEDSGRAWGVVTNKPGGLARPLLDSLGLLERAACVVAGDDLPERKPRPEPLWHACREAGAEPGNTVYIGDAEGDMLAARAAGCAAVVAAYGYIQADIDPGQWGGDALVNRPEDLMAVLFD